MENQPIDQTVSCLDCKYAPFAPADRSKMHCFRRFIDGSYREHPLCITERSPAGTCSRGEHFVKRVSFSHAAPAAVVARPTIPPLPAITPTQPMFEPRVFKPADPYRRLRPAPQENRTFNAVEVILIALMAAGLVYWGCSRH